MSERRTVDLDDLVHEGGWVQVLIDFQPIRLIVHVSNDYNIDAIFTSFKCKGQEYKIICDGLLTPPSVAPSPSLMHQLKVSLAFMPASFSISDSHCSYDLILSTISIPPSTHPNPMAYWLS